MKTRREALGVGAGAAAVAGALASGSGARAAPGERSASAASRAGGELAGLDALETAARIRRGDVTPSEVLEACVERIERLHPRLNFLVTPAYERARERVARGRPVGPFGGAPILIKDLDDVVGLPTRNGSRWDLAAPAARTQAPLIDALEAAGFVVLGKSATPEYGFLPTTEPVAFGPTRNPYDPGRSSGGSSGGAAAAVASRALPLAHGSDGGGSLRIPASCCNLFGLKPSRGRTVADGDSGSAPPQRRSLALGVEHCLTRTVRDSAAVLAVTERREGGLYPPVGLVARPSSRRLRVGLLLTDVHGTAPDPRVRERILATARLLEGLGHRVEETRWTLSPAFIDDFLLLWAEGADQLARAVSRALGRPAGPDDLEPFTLGLAELFRATPPAVLPEAAARLLKSEDDYAAAFAAHDVILSPVVASPPPELGRLAPTVPFEELKARLISYVGYTPVQNVAGAPAMSVPAGLTPEGLPVGAHFAAAQGEERTLLELAFELEAAAPWARAPAIGA